VLDELAVAPVAPAAPDAGTDAGTDGGSAVYARPSRTLGAGRHTLAASDGTFAVVYLETTSNPLTLSLATFGAKGAATGIVNPFSAGSTVIDASNPVVAALPCDRYAVAWGDYDAQGGDELDVALRIVDPAVPVSGPPAHANSNTNFSQFDPDIVWTGSELAVAWVDDSNAATQPDLWVRTFDANGVPTNSEQPLAATADSEADVALVAFNGSWAAAWRDDAGGLETVRVHAESMDWTIGPAFLPAPVSSKPALAPLDGNHLLAVYAVGVDSTDSGVANGSAVWTAVIDVKAPPGTVTGTPLATALSSTHSLSYAAATNVVGQVFVAWWTDATPGDPNGEDGWLESLRWDGTTLTTGQAEIPLPRWPQARHGDQRAPALAAVPSSGALAAAWDDLGLAIQPREGNGDVVVELLPNPVTRLPGEVCATGWVDCDGNPENGCEIDITQPAHCGSCGNACSAGAICVASGGSYSCLACPSSAPLGCGAVCVDPTSNPSDCGGCGHVCTTTVANAQPSCTNSTCGYACNSGYGACGGGCYQTQSDPNHCGASCAVCSSGQTCSGGTCM
jgi:hypothetical protein